MKGMELPISTLIIIIIALLLFLALLAFFFGVWNPGRGSMNQESIKNNICQMLVSTGCSQNTWSIPIRDFDANKNNTLNDAGDVISTGPSLASGPWLYTDNCGSTARAGDNLAALCICYYNLQNDTDCKKILCGCKL